MQHTYGDSSPAWLLIGTIGLAIILFLHAGSVLGMAPVDGSIKADVEWVLKTDTNIGNELIQVQVVDGIVFLSGQVTTLGECRRAEQLAARVNGVRAIENNLTFSISGRCRKTT